ncbi:putative transcription factor TFIIH subunit Tfb4 [Xylariales sp. AK1849]|nr:putative transcription factor TFIIH subunit Tfb4 [Xylariales sp. AK1849]
MNSIDGSAHYEVQETGQTPSLLTLIIDTNPRAWATLEDTLPFSKAIANILVFVNAHLAFGNDNQVAILAAHSSRAVWLYPKPPSKRNDQDGDVEMSGTYRRKDRGIEREETIGTSANKYPQFAVIESSILSSLRSLMSQTSPTDLPSTTLVSGALTTALSYIHKTSLAFAPPKQSADPANPSSAPSSTSQSATLHARILVISVSDSEPAQYIATMNAVFAASHARIPIDTLSLSPHASPTFLQQAAFITSGSYLSCAANLSGLLSYLMFGLLPDAEARAHLVTPSQDSVDFRAACFCHRKVIDKGFVCSICLSIFCDVPEGAECLTCGTRLTLGKYGAKPVVVVRKKKKKKKLNGVNGREETGSAAGTPVPA